MRHSAILAAAAALFCVALPSVASAQREIPRKSIIKRPADSSATAKSGTLPVPGPAVGIVPGTGSIMGAALDSLHNGMLANAGVSVVGLHRHATTNGNGLFRIDSVPPGKYVLEVTHPILDSLGIRLQSDSVPVVIGQVQTVELAVPSVRTVTATVCTPAKLRFGPAVILGKVVDADTDKPAVGAEVSVAWMETEVSNTIGLRTTPRVRKATVEADGTYRICGVPANLQGTLQAERGGAKTAEVPIQSDDRGLTVRMLYMPPPVVASSDTTSATKARRGGRAVITGKVTNAGGVAVSGARVSVQGSAASASTGADGKFTLTGVVAGTQSLLVRRVGYLPVETPMDVTSLRTNDITVRLGTYSPVLTSVDVKAKSDPIESTGFERRRKMGMGKYMDLSQIQAISPTYTSDILRRIPGIYVMGSGSSATVATTRSNGCVAFVIDNNPVNTTAGQTIDEIVGEQDVVAIEFYQPVDVPMEFSGGQNSGCAMVLIWTKGKLDQRTPKK